MDISKLLINAIVDGDTVKRISEKVNLDEATTKKVLTVLAPIVAAKVVSLISTASAKGDTKNASEKASSKSSSTKKTSTAKKSAAKDDAGDLLDSLAGSLLSKVAGASKAKKSTTVKKVTR